MKLQSSRIIMFVLIGVLFLSVSSVCAETAEEYYNRGNSFEKQGNLAQAISYYTNSIRLYSKYAKAYYNRGNVGNIFSEN